MPSAITKPLKIIFAGTPEFALTPLQALIDSPHRVIAVYTQPDRPAGRGRKLTASPVKQLALSQDIPVFQPLSLKDQASQQQLAGLAAELMVVVAYGLILPTAVLQAPTLGCINIHASLLPRWRGAAPIQRAIYAGDRHTGITIMQMDEGLDSGDILSTVSTPIRPDDTAQQLHDRLAVMGAQALMTVITGLQQGSLTAILQDEALANYANKLSKSEAHIDWRQPAQQLLQQINAFNPWPVAQTLWHPPPGEEARVLRIWEAKSVDDPHDSGADGRSDLRPGTVVSATVDGIDVTTGRGTLRLTKVQLPGGRPMPVAEFMHAHDLSGACLG
ncbi:MAG: methionyl-tRNA formyltransferase [Gammaproteobacteria bacterium]|nr:MAG: methionyl-tRNA formyltransferase [Gammaproteobacteria bacterium]